MNNIFRGLIAGYGAKKLGGGCFSTIIIFIIIWYVLGQCNQKNCIKLKVPGFPIKKKTAVNTAVSKILLLVFLESWAGIFFQLRSAN